MSSISETMARMLADKTLGASTPGDSGRLSRFDELGSNPGALGAWCYVPDNIRPKAPLVVVLHGCTQNAAGYDRGSGWSRLADEHGFALLFPEQRRTNNANLCFNWFEPAHNRRDDGEPLSICEMIDAMIARHNIDPKRVFINGLSAGGAMTSVMLATYPERFAGGAIIAGLPFGTAANVNEALARMRNQALPDSAVLAKLVRDASDHHRAWPRISIWHGTKDRVVDASNAEAILAQWQAIHGLSPERHTTVEVDGHSHRVWRDRKGRAMIEDYRIEGMGHGTPLRTAGPDGIGTSGAHMLEAGISSTREIAKFWEIIDATPHSAAKTAQRAGSLPVAAKVAGSRGSRSASRPAANANNPSTGIGKVIEDALRSAGLMR